MTEQHLISGYNQNFSTVRNKSAPLSSLAVANSTIGSKRFRLVALTDLGKRGNLATLTSNDSSTIYTIPALTNSAQTITLPPTTVDNTGIFFIFMVNTTESNIGQRCNINTSGDDVFLGQIVTNVNCATTAIPASTTTISFESTARMSSQLKLINIGDFDSSGSGKWLALTNTTSTISFVI